jgi:Fic-DOC domain mobile mystery protein B
MSLEDLLSLELDGIIRARRWALTSPRKGDVITVAFLTELHRRMYEHLWKWAGQLRRTDHIEGVRWPTIGIEVNDLVGEARFWRERKLYPPDDIALRFHHRLLRIRVWEGGNGSHARLVADAIAVSLKRPPFRWGSTEAQYQKTARDTYLRALRSADTGDYFPLRDFARLEQNAKR